jgi:hypothetical protein
MSKRRGNNRAIRGTGRDYGRGILGGQVFYRISGNQVELLRRFFAEIVSWAAKNLANRIGTGLFLSP